MEKIKSSVRSRYEQVRRTVRNKRSTRLYAVVRARRLGERKARRCKCGSGAARRMAAGGDVGGVKERRGAGPERSIPPSVRASFHRLPLPFRYAT